MVKSSTALTALAVLLLVVCVAMAMPEKRNAGQSPSSRSQGRHRREGEPSGEELDPTPFESSVETRKPEPPTTFVPKHHGRQGDGKLSRRRRSAGISDLLKRAGQWSYFLLQYFLPDLDCASLQASGADPSVTSRIAQACQGLGLQQQCDDINQKRQLPRSNPDTNCNVRTMAQVVYDNCCTMHQPPRYGTQPPPLYQAAPQPVSCGRYMRRPRPRVVDGIPAVKCEFPWVAGLFKDKVIVNCGTSVVSEHYVATAAHCVKEDRWHYQVQAGKHFLDSSRDTTVQVRNVKRIIRHPDYTEDGMEFDDIALLELERPLQLGECVQPICLPEPGDAPLPFQSCTVAGWGVNSSNAFSASQPEELQRVDLTVYSSEACRSSFNKDRGLVRDTMLCAANGMVGGRDACTGDSGGPLMCLQDNTWKLFGIVSMGYGCALPGEPGYYTAVSKYRRWLDSYLHTPRHRALLG